MDTKFRKSFCAVGTAYYYKIARLTNLYRKINMATRTQITGAAALTVLSTVEALSELEQGKGIDTLSEDVLGVLERNLKAQDLIRVSGASPMAAADSARMLGQANAVSLAEAISPGMAEDVAANFIVDFDLLSARAQDLSEPVKRAYLEGMWMQISAMRQLGSEQYYQRTDLFEIEPKDLMYEAAMRRSRMGAVGEGDNWVNSARGDQDARDQLRILGSELAVLEYRKENRSLDRWFKGVVTRMKNGADMWDAIKQERIESNIRQGMSEEAAKQDAEETLYLWEEQFSRAFEEQAGRYEAVSQEIESVTAGASAQEQVQEGERQQPGFGRRSQDAIVEAMRQAGGGLRELPKKERKSRRNRS